MRLQDIFRRASSAFALTDRLFLLRDRLAARPGSRTRFAAGKPVRLGLDALEAREMPHGTTETLFAVGAAAGSPPQVRVYDAGGTLLRSFLAYDAAFLGGVRTAVFDLTGDGVSDVVTAPGAGLATTVKVFDGATGGLVTSFPVYEPTFTGGAFVAAGPIGNGEVGIVTGADAGGGPHVCVFTAAGKERRGWFAFDSSFLGGVRVAVGVSAAGNATVVAAAGAGGGPNVRQFETRSGNMLQSYYAYDPLFGGGVFVATADLTGDEVTEVVTGAGAGGGPHANVFDGRSGKLLSSFYADAATNVAGLPVGAAAVGGTPAVATLVSPSLPTAQVKLFAVPAGGGSATEAGAFGAGGGAGALGGPGGPGVGQGCLTRSVVGGLDPNPPVPRVYPNGVCIIASYYSDCELKETVASGNGNVPVPNPRQKSGKPVRYYDGAVAYENTDLDSLGFGVDWGFTRSWTNVPEFGRGSFLGRGWIAAETPSLLQFDGGATLVVVTNDSRYRYFDQQFDGSYKVKFFLKDTLTYDAAAGQYVLTDEGGRQVRFWDFSASRSGYQRGQFAKFTDPAGNVTEVTATNADGKIQEVQRAGPAGGSTVTESYLFTYTSSTGTSPGQVASVTLRRKVGAGSWSTARSVEYTYYNGTESFGNEYDLKKAVVKDGAGTAIDTSYYRYWVEGEAGGYKGGLKYAFGPRAYARLAANVSNPETASDATVAGYADEYFEYDDSFRATKEVAANAGCSQCSGGFGTYTLAYTASTNAAGFNSWAVKTVETLPDGHQNTVYTNAYTEPMLRVYKDTTTNQEWRWFARYDADGRVVLQADPSAVTGHDDTLADLVNYQAGNAQYLADSAGLVRAMEYGASTTATSSTAGDVAGYPKRVSLKRGETGTAVPQEDTAYIKRTASGTDLFFRATKTAYRNDDGTGGQTTSTAYTWQGSTAQPASVTVTLPTVTTAQNGPGTATSEVTVLDDRGRPVWAKDQDGFITYTEYDQATGAVTKRIADVDTTQTSTFTNLPSGWSTPTGGGLHLTTTYEVDALGRRTKVTFPNGRVDYMTYNDPGYEVRTYPGWDTTTSTPTGPTQVRRDDRANGYIETLTMSATPTVSGGRPTGAESISGIQSLSRDLRNAAGQVVNRDRYIDLTGVSYSTAPTLGTENTNYTRTRVDYDKAGRLHREQTPTGTIHRTVFDGQGRPMSEWVGTDDTPTTGFWSPTNTAGTDLVKVREYEYDGGGVGDGTRTKVTEIPGGGAANRVIQMWYDWRDRLVIAKRGVEGTEATDLNRPLTHLTYDNLDHVTARRQYDGDGVSVTVTNGVPQQPSGSLLRAYTVTSFDELGRAYRDQTYSADPANGTVSSSALTADRWFDQRGNVIKEAKPGGLVTKTAYDGAGRPTAVYSTDGGSDTGWSDADDVTGDVVLEQAETTCDASGNVLTAVTRQRFHDETGTGALGTPTSGVHARVSYTGYYYDKADRLTDEATVGTNGGSAWTRPSSVPARSDTVLVTSRAYDAAGRVRDVTDPRGLVTRTTFDLAGRATKTVEAYTDGVVTMTTNKTVRYAYDGSDHQASLTVDLPGGGVQETQWVYGVSGSTITSNDLLKEVRWPDPTTGSASSSEKDSYSYNALGQRVTVADRNGNTHTYSYDVAGRQTADAVTTLGANVDGAVRRLETAYDGQGNPYLVTQYDAASSGNVVNQVKREFNGLKQLTREWQSLSGAVTGSSPSVQYAYSAMAGGANHSRLTSMTHPSGWVLTYDYGTSGGLDDRVSRLSALKDGTTTLEGYAYLGVGTAVRRDRPQPGGGLTYIKQAGESNGDAGDQYTGLDRFGRVADQRWVDVSGTALDRFQYGYDRDGSRLYRDNLLNNNYDELYHANGAANGYDPLNQLSEFRRGPLSDANSDTIPDTVTTASRSQAWTPDAVGNFSNVTTDGTSQARTHNRQNEITSVSGVTTPAYDANGNLTTDETGRTFQYDAWDRVVGVNGSARYAYDGLNRRVKEGTRELYYTSQWQVVEERASGVAVVRHVWSPEYVDALVLRDRDADGSSGNGLEERLYAAQDGNWNITALVATSGTVAERYTYDAFGARTMLDAGWSMQGATGYAWVYGLQGGRLDTSAGSYYFRNRNLITNLMRWDRNDPIGYRAGDPNLVRYLDNNPTSNLDPDGLQRQPVPRVPGQVRRPRGRNEEEERRLAECEREFYQNIRELIGDYLRCLEDGEQPAYCLRIYADALDVFRRDYIACIRGVIPDWEPVYDPVPAHPVFGTPQAMPNPYGVPEWESDPIYGEVAAGVFVLVFALPFLPEIAIGGGAAAGGSEAVGLATAAILVAASASTASAGQDPCGR